MKYGRSYHLVSFGNLVEDILRRNSIHNHFSDFNLYHPEKSFYPIKSLLNRAYISINYCKQGIGMYIGWPIIYFGNLKF